MSTEETIANDGDEVEAAVSRIRIYLRVRPVKSPTSYLRADAEAGTAEFRIPKNISSGYDLELYSQMSKADRHSPCNPKALQQQQPPPLLP
jgi:hypothetical protein